MGQQGELFHRQYDLINSYLPILLEPRFQTIMKFSSVCILLALALYTSDSKLHMHAMVGKLG
jgi:hypothetical protein